MKRKIYNELLNWKNTSDSKVDFLLYTNDGIIPIEVKASDKTQSKSLNILINQIIQ